MSTTHEEDRSTEPRTNGGHSETSTTECTDCGGYVTRDYHRVFSDNDGELHGCLGCGGHGVPRGGNR